MNLKRTLALALIGAAVTAWLYAAATSNSRHFISTPVERGAVDARGDMLANEAARLHERLRPNATPRRGRNLFQFTAARPRPEAAAVRPALSEAAPAAPAPIPFKLIGIAEDRGADGPVRTAIVSAPGQVFLVKVGDALTLRYRVTKISADVLELTDLADQSTQRLALR